MEADMHRRKHAWHFAAAAMLSLIAVLAARPTSAQDDPVAAMRAARVQPPAAAPELTFQTLDEQPARLDSLRGRPVVLTFFSTV